MALTEMRTLMLWALLAKTGGAAYQSEIKPEVKKPDREALVKDGLITSEKRGRAVWLEVTDKGWAWAGDHIDADLPKRTIHGAAVFQAWLGRLKAFMENRGLTLADVLGPLAQPEPAPSASDPLGLRDRVRKAYLDATGGRLNQRVFLEVLRDRLRDVRRSDLDDTLRKMHVEEGSHLSGSDNPPELTAAIREASLDFKGERMFVIWITK